MKDKKRRETKSAVVPHKCSASSLTVVLKAYYYVCDHSTTGSLNTHTHTHILTHIHIHSMKPRAASLPTYSCMSKIYGYIFFTS